MICPFCGYDSSRVLESRSTSEGSSIRRRRECENCLKRFTTYEKVELVPILVTKRSGSKEEYSREKLFHSLMNACSKSCLLAEDIDEIIDNLEYEISAYGKREVSSIFIGENILMSLKKLNQVAYIRYMSVFKKFNSLNDFVKEINHFKQEALQTV